MLRNLVRGLEETRRQVYFVHNAPLPRLRLIERINNVGWVLPEVSDRFIFVHNGLDRSDYSETRETRVLPKPYIL